MVGVGTLVRLSMNPVDSATFIPAQLCGFEMFVPTSGYLVFVNSVYCLAIVFPVYVFVNGI